MAKLSKILTLFVLGAALSACPAKPRNEGSKSWSEYIFGDPMMVVKGQELRPNLFLEKERIENGEWIASHVVRFAGFVENQNENRETTAQTFEAKDWNYALERHYRFVKTSEGLEFRATKGDNPSFIFTREDRGAWRLKRLGTYSARLIHFSRDEKLGLMTWLVDAKDSHGSANLISFTFSELRDGNKDKIQIKSYSEESLKRFAYFGGDRPYHWPGKKKSVALCGEADEDVVKAFERGVRLWNEALNDLFVLEGEKLKSAPPFSDLNSTCLYVVPDYIIRSHPTDHSPGQTFFTGNPDSGLLVDSDVFVWLQEVKGILADDDSVDSRRQLLNRIVLHELGHFLGLDHVDPKSEEKSIMSPRPSENELSDYDREAIQNLYKRD